MVLCVHEADNDVSYLIDAQAFYVRHINSEPGAEELVWDYDNQYWALNVFLAQVTDDSACVRVSSVVVIRHRAVLAPRQTVLCRD